MAHGSAGGAVAYIEPARLQRMFARTFTAFKIANIGDSKKPKWRTYALDIAPVRDIGEAVGAACSAQAFSRGDRLCIREEGESGVQLHLFTVRQKSAARRVYEGYAYRNAYDMYFDPDCTVDGAVFA